MRRDHNRRVSGSKLEVTAASFFCTFSYYISGMGRFLYFPLFLLFFRVSSRVCDKEMVDIRQEMGIQSRDYLSFKSLPPGRISYSSNTATPSISQTFRQLPLRKLLLPINRNIFTPTKSSPRALRTRTSTPLLTTHN
jgi:hypothetical protein